MPISKLPVSTSVLVMLSGNACSPCYIFETEHEKVAGLPSEDLREVLLWAAKAEPELPELFVLVGDDEPLDSSVASVLEGMGDQVVTPLLPIGKRASLGIPFSRNQTIVARNLKEIVDQADNIAGCPIILHIERGEIGRLGEGGNCRLAIRWTALRPSFRLAIAKLVHGS